MPNNPTCKDCFWFSGQSGEDWCDYWNTPTQPTDDCPNNTAKMEGTELIRLQLPNDAK